MIKKKKKRQEIWISGKDMTELHFLLALFCLLPQIEGGNIRYGGIWVILDFFTPLFLSLDRSEFLGLSCLLIVERIMQAISSSKERITCSFVNWMVKKKKKGISELDEIFRRLLRLQNCALRNTIKAILEIIDKFAALPFL